MDISLSAYPLPYILLASLPVIWLRSNKNSRSSLPLPPGPKRLAIVGNLFNFPPGNTGWFMTSGASNMVRCVALPLDHNSRIFR